MNEGSLDTGNRFKSAAKLSLNTDCTFEQDTERLVQRGLGRRAIEIRAPDRLTDQQTGAERPVKFSMHRDRRRPETVGELACRPGFFAAEEHQAKQATLQL